MGHIVNRVLVMVVVTLALSVCVFDPQLIGHYIPGNMRGLAAACCLVLSFFGILWYATFEPGKSMKKFGGFSYSTKPDEYRFLELLKMLRRYRYHSMMRRTIWRLMKSVPDVELLKEDSLKLGRIMQLLQEYPATFNDEINDLQRFMLQDHIAHVKNVLGRATSEPNAGAHVYMAFQALLQATWLHGESFPRRVRDDFINVLGTMNVRDQEFTLRLVVRDELRSADYLKKSPFRKQIDDAYMRFVTEIKNLMDVAVPS